MEQTLLAKDCCAYKNPASICFEEDLSDFDIRGLRGASCPEFQINQGVYPDPATGAPTPNPTSILRVDQSFTVDLRWQVDGHAVHYVTGEWRYAVYLHRLDAASAPVSKQGAVAMNTNLHTFEVDRQFVFNPGDVPKGVYKVYVTVRFFIPGKGYAAIGGFGKGMALHVYDPQEN